jgi:hypothetical protein
MTDQEPKKLRPFIERFPDIKISKSDGGAFAIIGGVRPPKPAEPSPDQCQESQTPKPKLQIRPHQPWSDRHHRRPRPHRDEVRLRHRCGHDQHLPMRHLSPGAQGNSPRGNA